MKVVIRDRRHWWASKFVVWRMNRSRRGQRAGNGVILYVERLVRRIETRLRSTSAQAKP